MTADLPATLDGPGKVDNLPGWRSEVALRDGQLWLVDQPPPRQGWLGGAR